MWATPPRQLSTRWVVSPTAKEPAKTAVGAITTWAPGSNSRSQATRGNVHSGAAVSFQDSSHASDRVRPVSSAGAIRTPAMSNQAGPAAGWAGWGPKRSVPGGASGGNQVTQPCA
ncbi:hypothetical protein [Mycobacterium tuberculosis]|uniref:Uncharacterized protein n=1 Tax=Mycobacterium tuberculosis TaxID=1773 RepID=A0A655IN66_MYCTX|nr:hypothetical protein [Mycobacterium tuberculosis]COW01611.1 Uncharacterised protein [Mycobacterium tuberculosis]